MRLTVIPREEKFFDLFIDDAANMLAAPASESFPANMRPEFRVVGAFLAVFVGTLVLTTLLTALVTFYLGFHASKMEPRPEDRKEAEIARYNAEVTEWEQREYFDFF